MHGAASPLLRWLPVVVLAAAGIAFWLMSQGGGPVATLRAAHAALTLHAGEAPATTALLYFLLYVAAIVCALPLANLLALLAGALFGVAGGAAMAMVATATGDMLFFLVMRGALGSRLSARIAARARRLDAGFAENAFNYVLALRVLPVIPFWLVNLAAASAGVRFRTFATATAIGIIPAAIIYAGIGSGMAAVLREGAPFDTGLLMQMEIVLPLTGLALLAVLPVLWRRFRRRPATESRS